MRIAQTAIEVGLKANGVPDGLGARVHAEHVVQDGDVLHLDRLDRRGQSDGGVDLSIAVSAWYVCAAIVSSVRASWARPVTSVTLAKSDCTVGVRAGLVTVTAALPCD